ncbi:uncharacterized protein [Amphiura filiformis]|uniref:uncharacterized protein n=1 Tax=Amphiura filiformis TaxID=82378 RepID=UPI003B20C5A0
MSVNRSNQGSKTTSKPRALNSLTKSTSKSSKAVAKKRSSKKSTSPPSISPGFSLYSSDSDSAGVSSLNHGLDRCAALLANILDEDALDVPSKKHATKKQAVQSRQPLKGKPTPRATSMKKKKQGQNVAQKPVGNCTKKPAAKGSSIPRTSVQDVKPTVEVRIPQATQFNNRLVSSTPDMGSPNQSRCLANDGNKQTNRLPNSSIYRDPSLEALAAQIQMLRSQAEANENLSDHSEHVPVRVTSVDFQSGDRMQPSAFEYEKMGHGEPRQLLQNLTDHLKDRNIKNQVLTTETFIPEGNHGTVQSQAWQHHVLPNQHQTHLGVTPESQNKLIPGDTGQTMLPPPRCTVNQHSYHGQLEPPESRNTSFIAEYHPLPAQNIGTSQSGEMILKQLNEMQTAVTLPVSHETTSQNMQSDHATNLQIPFDDSKFKQVTNQSVGVKKVIPSQTLQSLQRKRTTPVAEHHERQTKMSSNRIKADPIETMCIGTQTYSPPADKGVQTSVMSSPSSSEVRSSVDADANSNAIAIRDTIENALQDTPHPQPRITVTGKKTASWEQMRILKFLIGELRAAICDIGEDKDVQRLLTEIEECLHTLQYLPPDLQTEIGLALQPLRSENSQLRRRLRIANQQIRRWEKGEDKENMEPPVDVEVLTLQSLNAKLQRDLRGEESKVNRLAESSAEYKTTIDNMKQKHKDMMNLLQQKDAHQLESRQEWMEEKSALNNRLDEMKSRLTDFQLRVDATENENRILRLNLQQRDAEMTRLNQDADSKYLYSKSNVFMNENDRISESDEDDDETPKASPQHSPAKIQNVFFPPTRHFVDLPNQHTQTLARTTKFETIPETSDKDYPPQSFSKRVTFAEHVSPNRTRFSTEMTGGYPRNVRHGDGGGQTMSHHSEQWVTNGKQSFDMDDVTESHKRSYPLHFLHSEAADKDFSMRKFLERSRPLSSDEDVPESDHSNGDFNKPKEANVYTLQHAHNAPVQFDEGRTQFHNHVPQIRQHNFNDRFDNNVFLSKTSPQDAIFQGSVLDGSMSGIDCTSTQSSVTSQYEAQFQLGLANLDTEIAKLQNSLKSISTEKPVQNYRR